MSKFNHYPKNYIPTKEEKNTYLKQYMGSLVIALVLITPFVIYFVNMKP